MALSGWEEIMKCSEGVNEMSGLGGGGGGGRLNCKISLIGSILSVKNGHAKMEA